MVVVGIAIVLCIGGPHSSVAGGVAELNSINMASNKKICWRKNKSKRFKPVVMSSRGQKACIPMENRGKIIVLGISYRKIAARIGCSVGSVCKIVKKPTAHGSQPHNGKTKLSHEYHWVIGVTLLHRFMLNTTI